jgi:hypothetical protein
VAGNIRGVAVNFDSRPLLPALIRALTKSPACYSGIALMSRFERPSKGWVGQSFQSR